MLGIPWRRKMAEPTLKDLLTTYLTLRALSSEVTIHSEEYLTYKVATKAMAIKVLDAALVERKLVP